MASMFVKPKSTAVIDAFGVRQAGVDASDG